MLNLINTVCDTPPITLRGEILVDYVSLIFQSIVYHKSSLHFFHPSYDPSISLTWLSLSLLFNPLRILSHKWSNPITLSKNDEKSSGFPGGKGLSSDKSLSFNVSSSVLWMKRQWNHHILNFDWLLILTLVLSKSKFVNMVKMDTWVKSCDHWFVHTCKLRNASDHPQPADLPIPSDDCPLKVHWLQRLVVDQLARSLIHYQPLRKGHNQIIF